MGQADDYAASRKSMVEHQLRRRRIVDERVLAAMEKVPRHRFLPCPNDPGAYGDYPLPIGSGQTISQPYMVAIMTEALSLAGHETVLEIGTGSGYQTAILARLAARIYTVEREPELVEGARRTLARLAARGLLDVSRVEFIEGDGSVGYAPAAPYDAILVAAAAPAVPHAMEQQLAEGGRLVIPVGDLNYQELRLIRKVSGRLTSTVVNECRFVPLVGRHGWSR